MEGGRVKGTEERGRMKGNPRKGESVKGTSERVG